MAKPLKAADGSTDVMRWECRIPAKPGSAWERPNGEGYRLTMTFSEDYPMRPPDCKFAPPIFHPNIYPSGTVCLSLLSEEKANGWKPTVTLKDLLKGIQELLDSPNLSDPAQREAFLLCRDDKTTYTERVKQLAKAYSA